MPLNKPGLKSALESLFNSPGATNADCAQGWADAMQSYASGVIPASTTVAAAAATLKTALQAAFAMRPSGAANMETAFTAFGAAVGGGMAGYVPTPPPGPVGFVTQFALKPDTHADAAQAISDLIDAWMKTGIATLAVPPNTPVNWS